MPESKPQARDEEFFDIVDLRRVKVSSRRGVERGQELKRFFRELGFYVDGAAVASKIYEKHVESSIHRLFIEVYNAEGCYSAVFAVNTRDVEELKQLVKLFNSILEREATSRGYRRVV
jgi:hypothetical protein